MSDMNEKIISEFLDLMKKVNSLDVIVQGIARDHDEMMKRTTKMLQTFQDKLSESLNKQNELVQNTNDNLATQVNNTINKIGNVVENHINHYLHKNGSVKDYDAIQEKQRSMEVTLEKIHKNFSFITRGFKAALEQEVREDSELPILEKKIDSLNFTTRTIHCLWAESIKTINDLLQYTELRLLKTPNLGKKSMREIKSVLADLGLYLKGSEKESG